ncbi:MAG: protein kinase, partial [Planctomycetes bacterium]|nr:protein kinase [Planctomycetota bacterium]
MPRCEFCKTVLGPASSYGSCPGCGRFISRGGAASADPRGQTPLRTSDDRAPNTDPPQRGLTPSQVPPAQASEQRPDRTLAIDERSAADWNAASCDRTFACDGLPQEIARTMDALWQGSVDRSMPSGMTIKALEADDVRPPLELLQTPSSRQTSTPTEPPVERKPIPIEPPSTGSQRDPQATLSEDNLSPVSPALIASSGAEATPPDRTLADMVPPATAATEPLAGSPPRPAGSSGDRTIEGLLDSPPGASGPQVTRSESVPWSSATRPESSTGATSSEAGERKPSPGAKTTPPAGATIGDLVIKQRVFRSAADGGALLDAEYELIEVLGEGGMGIVYAARQRSINRHVAVKMLKRSRSGPDEMQAARQKFLAEAVVTGDLDHPNIVPIYDVGRNENDALFYSMKQVQGTPWLDVIGSKPLFENLDILMKVCDAVAFAHARGIVHRDLKPENVMLGEFGEVQVMDWGLALPTERFRKSANVPRNRGMGGTPAYMAPEMAVGPIEKIGTHSDIYLLGAILFEIVAGVRPHEGANARECLIAAARNEIAHTDKGGELLDIALRAMSTRPEDRHRSVQAFQAAIREYLSHTESITLATHAEADLAKAETTDNYDDFQQATFGFRQALELWEGNSRARTGLTTAQLLYARSAYRRGDFDLAAGLLDLDHPDHAELHANIQRAIRDRDSRQEWQRRAKRVGVGLVAMIFGIVALAAVWINNERAEAERQRSLAVEALDEVERQRLEAERQREAAVAARDEAERQKVAALAAKEEVERQKGLVEEQRQEAVKQAERARDQANLAEQRRVDAEAARKQAQEREEEAVAAREKEADARRLAEERKRLAQARQEEAEQAREDEKIQRQLAVAQKSRAEAALAREAEERARADAQRLKAEQARKAAEAARAAEAYEAYIARIGLAAAKIRENAFGTALELLEQCRPASPSDPDLRNWEWGRLAHLCSQDLRSFEAGGPLEALAVAPDGTWFVTGGRGGHAQVRALPSGQILTELPHNEYDVHALAISPDGRYIASGSADPAGYVRLWDATTGALLRRVGDGSKSFETAHTAAVLSVAFSHDGRRLLTSSYDETARLWNVPTGAQIQKFWGHTGWVWRAAFCPNVDADGATRNEVRIATASQDGTVRIWNDVSKVAEPAWSRIEGDTTFREHDGPVYTVAFSPDGALAASGGYDRRVLVWDPQAVAPDQIRERAVRLPVEETPRRVLDGHTGPVWSLSFFDDGGYLLSGSGDNTVRVWNVARGEAFKTFRDDTGSSAPPLTKGGPGGGATHEVNVSTAAGGGAPPPPPAGRGAGGAGGGAARAARPPRPARRGGRPPPTAPPPRAGARARAG